MKSTLHWIRTPNRSTSVTLRQHLNLVNQLLLGVIDYFAANKICLKNVKAIDSDGAAVDTGNKDGAIRLLGRHLGKLLQWLICPLHTNELSIRHLMKEPNANTYGLESYSAPIGKQIRDCKNLKIERYHLISSSEVNVDEEELSTDQKYLLQIYGAVRTGQMP